MFLTWESLNAVEHQAAVVIVVPMFCILPVSFLLSGSLASSLLIMLGSGLVQLHLFGVLWWADVKLNYISLSYLTLAYAYSVQYFTILTKGYDIAPSDAKKPSPAKNRDEKVKIGLNRFGRAILHGSISCFLQVLMMAGSQSYVMSTFCYIWIGAVMFTTLHSMVLLPVLLSFFGLLQQPSDSK